jgi:predicted CopG family antitoxin
MILNYLKRVKIGVKSFSLIINELPERVKNNCQKACFSQKNAVPSWYDIELLNRGK